MTDTVNKQKLLKHLFARDKDLKHGDVFAAIPVRSEVRGLIELVQDGEFDNPTPPTTPVQGYREALEWYADAATYTDTLEASKSSMFPNTDFYTTVDAPIKQDRGERARQALSQTDIQPSGWIPVSVRPDVEQMRCLVSDGNQHYMGGYIYTGEERPGFYADDAAPLISEEITHYMLVQPPGINSTEDDQPSTEEEETE